MSFDITIRGGGSSISFSNYDMPNEYKDLYKVWDEMRVDLAELVNLTGDIDDEVLSEQIVSSCHIDVESNGFIDPSEFNEVQDILPLLNVYWALEQYGSDEIDTILAYALVTGKDLEDINIATVMDALDNYFGEYQSNYEAAFEYLIDNFDMSSAAARFTLDLPNAVDTIINDNFCIYSGKFYYL